MAKTSVLGSCGRRTLLVSAALLAVGAVLAVLEQPAPGQTAGKKTDKTDKKAEGKPDPKKKPAEPYSPGDL